MIKLNKKDVLDYAYENYNLDVYPKSFEDIPEDILADTINALSKIDKEITKVVFRKWPNGTIDAYMPELIADYDGNCTSYTRIGQHSAAAYAYCISKTKAANPSEYGPLFKELTGLGYNVKVIKKYIRKK